MKAYKLLALAFLLSTVCANDALAQSTWNGGGGSGNTNWSDTANWVNGTAPGISSTITFAGTTSLNANNDLTKNTIFGSITFDSTAGAFTLTGQALKLSSNSNEIVDNSTALETINIGGGATSSFTKNTSVSVTSGGTLVIANAFQTSTATTLSKTGAGVLNWTGGYQITGATTVSAGTMLMNGVSSSGGGVSNYGVNSGATLGGAGTIVGAVTINSGGHLAPGTLGVGSAGTLNLSGSNVTLSGGSNLDFDLASSTTIGTGVNDLISMSGGTLNLASTGTMTININALGALSTSGTYTLISGAGSIVNFNAADFTTTGIGTDTATYSVVGNNLVVSFSSGSGPTPTTFAYFNGNGPDLNTAGNYNTDGTGTTPLTSAPTGTTNVFFSANSNSATSASTSAPLTVNSLNFGTGTGTNNGITISGTSAITIEATNANGNTAGVGITTLGSGTNTISAPITLGADQAWSIGSTGTGGLLTVSGTVSGAFALTKTGTGTLELSGANIYTGGTTVSTGTLKVSNTSGSATGSGSFTLSSGATLTGTGSIAVTATSTNATIAGNVIVGNGGTTDILHISSTAMTDFSGANLTFQLDSATTHSSSVDLGSTASVMFGNTTLTLNLNGATTIANGTEYVLFSSTAGSDIYHGLTLSGSIITNGLSITSLTGTNATNYQGAYLELVNVGGDFDIVAVVPEPSTWTLMLGGFALLVLFQRMRHSKNS